MLEMLLTQVIYGIILGSIYAMVAMGLTLIWSIADVPDFSQGGVYTFAGYALYFLVGATGSYFVSLPIAILIGAIMSITIERFLYKPVRDAPLTLLLIAIALFFLFDNLAIYLFTAKSKVVSSPLLNIIVRLGPLSLNLQRVLIPFITIIVFIVVNLIVTKTKIGTAARAAAQDRETAALVGINIDKVYLFIFALGGALTGLASSLLAPLYTVYPEMGVLPVLKALVVVVLGGMGSFIGAYIGGIILGVIEALGATYIAVEWQHGLAFIILIIVLVLKPSGLFGLKRM